MINSILFIFLTIVLEPLPISSSTIKTILLSLYNSSLSTLWFSIHILDHLCHGCVAFVAALFFRKRLVYLMRCIVKRRCAFILRLMIVGFIAEAITLGAYGGKPYIPESAVPCSLGFIITTLCLASLYWCTSGNRTRIRVVDGIFLGFAQAAALCMPGVSRLAVVYTVARWRGIRSAIAFELSWLIAGVLYAGAALRALYYSSVISDFYNPYVIVAAMVFSATIAYVCFYVVWLCERTNGMYWWACVTAYAAWYTSSLC